MSFLFPLLSVLVITVFLGSLGGLFIFLTLNTPLGEWPVVIIGSSLVIFVPAIAYLLERSIAKE